MEITVVKDTIKAEKIRKAIRENDGYCPCNLLKVPETRCMCKEFIEKKTSGHCHCGLYYKKVED